MKIQTLYRSLHNGLLLLKHDQQINGNYSSTSISHQSKSRYTYTTTFLVSHVCSALSYVSMLFENIKSSTDINDDIVSLTKNIQHCCCDFILQQKNSTWSWNYGAKSSKEFHSLPYPDDLDDTFIALITLKLCRPEIINGTVLKAIINILTANEIQLGGPYYTWIIDNEIQKTSSLHSSQWKDTDIVVNSVIAYFLSLFNIELDSLTMHVENMISSTDFNSTYYPSWHMPIYSICRWYKGSNLAKIKSYINEKEHEQHPMTMLQKALLVLSKLHIGCTIDEVSSYISEITHYLTTEDQSIATLDHAYCIDPQRNGLNYVACSKDMTMAYCCAALSMYIYKDYENKNKQDTEYKIEKYVHLHKSVIDYTKNNYTDIISAKIADKIANSVPHFEITLFPFYFNDSLKNKNQQSSVTIERCIQLGSINLLGWYTYTLIDDAIDNSNYIKQHNFSSTYITSLLCIQKIYHLFSGILTDFKYISYIHQYMERMHKALLWEINTCRLIKLEKNVYSIKYQSIPHYSYLKLYGDKSIGHALGPLSILFLHSYSPSSRHVQSLSDFLHCYIICKQLNDDAHDWYEDLQNGIFTPIHSMMFRHKLKQSKNKSKTLIINVLTENKKLHALFWSFAVPKLYKVILYHEKRAYALIEKLSLIMNTTYIESLIKAQVQTITSAYKESVLMHEYMQ